MKINEIHLNPKNPRTIKDEKYQKLKNSIKEFPKMMKLRPIVVDDNMTIIGGNMRYRILQDLGYKEIPEGWVVKASELTEEEKKDLSLPTIYLMEIGIGRFSEMSGSWENWKSGVWNCLK